MLNRNNLPRTRQEQKGLQMKGDIRGWAKLPPGRPPNRKRSIGGIEEPIQKKANIPTKTKKLRGSYQRWTQPENKEFVTAVLNGDETNLLAIPRSTLYSF